MCSGQGVWGGVAVASGGWPGAPRQKKYCFSFLEMSKTCTTRLWAILAGFCVTFSYYFSDFWLPWDFKLHLANFKTFSCVPASQGFSRGTAGGPCHCVPPTQLLNQARENPGLGLPLQNTRGLPGEYHWAFSDINPFMPQNYNLAMVLAWYKLCLSYYSLRQLGTAPRIYHVLF